MPSVDTGSDAAVARAAAPEPRSAAACATAAPEPRVRGRRVAALDGLRAAAVLAVLGFHGGLTWARGGFLGVDAFFVLSGYLIVSLLLAESQRTGRIAIVAFWARRIRRLLPALLLLVAVVTM